MVADEFMRFDFFFFFLFFFARLVGFGSLKFLRERLVWVKSVNFTLYVLMQMIIAVELRHIYGCIVSTLCMISSLLNARSTFFLYYVYKVSLLFRVILSYVPRLS